MGHLRVTDNDLILYRYLFEQDFLTREQIKNYVWKDLSNSHIDNRLARLTKEGYIKKHPDLSAGVGTVLMAGSGAVGLLNNETIVERMVNLRSDFINKKDLIRAYRERKKLNFARYNHDEYLTNVRFVLQGFGEEYMSYRMLMVYNRNVDKKSKKYTRPTPDALMYLDGDTIAIELENTLKQDFRYQDKIFSGYEKDDRVDTVLYICTNDTILKNINRNILNFDGTTNILVVDYKKVINAKTKFVAMVYRVRPNNNIKVIRQITFNMN